MAFDYTNEQIDVIEHETGPALVLSVAGSGKSQTLIARTKSLLQKGYDPEMIHILIFNTEACEDFNRRLDIEGIEGVQAFTFHAFALTLLLHLKSDDIQLISDKAVYHEYIKNHIILFNKSHNYDKYKTISTTNRSVNNVISHFELLKNNDYPANNCGDLKVPDRFFKLFEFSENYRKLDNVCSFTDLLYDLCQLIRNDVKFNEFADTYMQHVMVDEFQDGNPLQQFLLNSINPKSLVLVGDDDQAIYAFRGGKPEYLLNGYFERHPDAKIFKLSQSFRFGHMVSVLANSLIENNGLRHEKCCISAKTTPHTDVHVMVQEDPLSTVAKSAPQLDGYHVLVRTHEEKGALKLLLANEGYAPNLHEGETQLSGHAELAFIDALINYNLYKKEPLSIDARNYFSNSILSSFTQNLNFEEYERIEDEMNAMPIEKCLRYWSHRFKNPDFVERVNSLNHFFKNIDTLRDLPVRDFLVRLNKAIEPHQNNFKAKLPLQYLYKIAKEGQTFNDIGKHLTAPKQAVNFEISTMHASKGRTFQKVYIPNLTQGFIPLILNSDRSLNFSALEEERRLFYVAITRAAKKLIITLPNLFDFQNKIALNKFGENDFTLHGPSQFLKELNYAPLKTFVRNLYKGQVTSKDLENPIAQKYYDQLNALLNKSNEQEVSTHEPSQPSLF